MRRNLTSGLALEERVGFSRAVVTGNLLVTSATAPVDENQQLVSPDPYTQAMYVLDKLRTLLAETDFDLRDVVRATVYIADQSRAEGVWAAFTEVLGSVRPTLSAVNVLPWSNPDMVVEIELLAVKAAGGG